MVCVNFIDIYKLRIGLAFMNILQTSIKQAYLVIDVNSPHQPTVQGCSQSPQATMRVTMWNPGTLNEHSTTHGWHLTADGMIWVDLLDLKGCSLSWRTRTLK